MLWDNDHCSAKDELEHRYKAIEHMRSTIEEEDSEGEENYDEEEDEESEDDDQDEISDSDFDSDEEGMDNAEDREQRRKGGFCGQTVGEAESTSRESESTRRARG